MAEEESAKRFNAIMDKLFRAPPKSSSKSISTTSPSNPSRAEWSRSKRTPYSTSLEVLEPTLIGKGTDRLQTSSGSSIGSVQAASCRPWDRDDLFKRLATFKSMTWFAKPQAVSALNCARRGWINIDMDIIACESCGARLLFSTPYSWTMQQVVKAANVFNLKLDSGHKLLCPWVDNTCEESLARFPLKPTDALVEDFKNRCSALLQLSALPVISPSVIVDCVKNPPLQEFLQGYSWVENNDSINLTNEPMSETSISFYQAKMLISLYGWEPRSVPYIVDCQKKQCMNDANSGNMSSSSMACGGSNLKVCPVKDGGKEVNIDTQVSDGHAAVSEPNSVVLNCTLCGASVGLWAFSSVSRPLEFLRLVGYTDINSKRDIGYSETPLTSKDKTSSLDLTIAGGPPPEKQNHKATISLPVVGRNLRGRFSLDSTAKRNHDNELRESASSLVLTSENMQVVLPDSSRNGKLVDNVESEDRVDSVVGNSYTEIEGAGMMFVGEGSDAIHLQATNQLLALHGGNTGKSSDHKLLNNSVAFDPIRQHRIFCPWIVSYANFAPGWKQTLLALQHHKKSNYPLSENTSTSLTGNMKDCVIEVDDPIASAKKFFTYPPTKRTKYHLSS